MQSYASSILQPLLAKPEYFETALQFVRCGGDLPRTAEYFDCHQNTIRYRLQKNQILLGFETETEQDFYAILGTRRTPASLADITRVLHSGFFSKNGITGCTSEVPFNTYLAIPIFSISPDQHLLLSVFSSAFSSCLLRPVTLLGRSRRTPTGGIPPLNG